MTRSSLAFLVGLLLGPWACGGETGIIGEQIPRLEVRAGQQVLLDGGVVIVRSDLPARIQVGNIGTGPLEIRAIDIESEPLGAFVIESLPMPSEGAPIVLDPDALAHAFAVVYRPEAVPDSRVASAQVTIRTNLTIDGVSSFAFRVASV